MATLNSTMQPMDDGNIDIKDADASKVWFLEQQMTAPLSHFTMAAC
jgi:hypothetical protein